MDTDGSINAFLNGSFVVEMDDTDFVSLSLLLRTTDEHLPCACNTNAYCHGWQGNALHRTESIFCSNLTALLYLS